MVCWHLQSPDIPRSVKSYSLYLGKHYKLDQIIEEAGWTRSTEDGIVAEDDGFNLSHNGFDAEGGEELPSSNIVRRKTLQQNFPSILQKIEFVGEDPTSLLVTEGLLWSSTSQVQADDLDPDYAHMRHWHLRCWSNRVCLPLTLR